MPSQASPVPPPVFAATVSPVAVPRGDLTAQRSTRRVTLFPKYGACCEVDVRYLWCGAPDAPTIIVQGGISADRDAVTFGEQAAGWWQSFIGEGSTIDLDRFRVLSIDWLTPRDLGSAQAVSSEDQADALAALVEALGIDRVHAFVGYSYGGMTGLAFAARHPYALDRLVLLGSAHRPHPLATAQRSVQRSIVRLGLESGQPEQALALARQLAMTTYRGSEEFVRRFATAPEYRDGRFHFPVEDYLEQAGRRFVARFDIERYLALSESIDLHDVCPEQIPTATTLIGTPSDRLVPLADLCELQRRLQGSATLEVIDSPYGHDAFLKESERLAPLLRDALA
ncbi:homoserine O-succinyltransferase MetX [Dyella sp.]|uniref:homoserine O-succinyltransferase MetX n=1 Tax=Dyella sp. TaxID=1869338 RepID=UPI002ED34B6C